MKFMRKLFAILFLLASEVSFAQAVTTPFPPDICFFEGEEFSVYGFAMVFRDLSGANAAERKLVQAGSHPRRDGTIVITIHSTREEASEDCLMLRNDRSLERIERISER